MEEKVKKLIQEFNEFEKRINEELQKKQEKIYYTFENGKTIFTNAQLEAFKKIKTGLFEYLFKSGFLTVATAPFIYFMIFPAIFLDLAVTVYQGVCFPVYGITKVQRKNYILIDRHKLKYLNSIQKLNCVYCGYFNGLIAYVREIASRTEQYWCPIRHSRKVKGLHKRHMNFIAYGDIDDFDERMEELRAKLKEIQS